MKNSAKWLEIRKSGDFSELGRRFRISPMLARIIRNRDVKAEEIPEYLEGKALYDPHLMKDMDRAVSLLREALLGKKRIRIIGDYDIDGVSATYILLKGIRRCGGEADYAIPDREKDGYGLNITLIDKAKEDGIGVIVTCDNGISAREEVQHAKELGMTVIVTDHHDIPYEETESERRFLLPPGDAVVDPKRRDCPYPFDGICGAVVAWKLVQCLYELMGIPAEEAEEFYENAAFATVGDVMDLRDENRVIVREGLKRLKETKSPGMRALILQTGLQDTELKAFHVGFVLGPCINASGRLDTAERSLRLLLCEDEGRAAAEAADLVALNESRKTMTVKGVEKAKERILAENLLDRPVLVVYLPEVHESLAGIIAGRLRESYHRPTLVLTKNADTGLVKGSGRSIEEYSMFDELTRVKELFLKYGGHPMAAGLTMEEKNVPVLSERLNRLCTLTEEDLTEKVRFDMVLPLAYVSEALTEELGRLEPFGKGNEKPLFALRSAEVLSAQVIGKNRNALRFRLRDQGTVMEGVWFGDPEEYEELIREKYGETVTEPLRLSFVYYPRINVYNGNRSLQLSISGFC